MRRLFLQLGFSLAAILLFLPSTAHATDTDVNVTVTIKPAFYLEVSGGPLTFWVAPTDYVLHPDTVKDADTGVVENMDAYGWTYTYHNVFVDVWAASPWKVKVQGNGGETFSPDSPWLKPVGDIVWQDGLANGWHRLKTTPVYVNQWNPYGPPSTLHHQQLSVGFRILLKLSKDLPGTYHYNSVLFTAMAAP